MAVDYRKKKFLVVDDFHEFRSAVRFMLQGFGVVHTDTANSGDSAISLIEINAYDVILCDYNLGYNQKDGQQILEEAKHRGLLKLTSIFLLITAENTSEMIMGVAEYYPDDYLLKPFTKDVLRARIEKAIRKKSNFELIDATVQRKEYRHAIELCEKQIKEDPPNLFEYLKLIGELTLQIGDYDKARDLYQEVLSIRDIPWAKIGLGRVCFHKQEYSQASDIFSSLIQENKMHIVAYDWLAKTMVRMNSPLEAQTTLLQAVQISPKSVNRQKDLGEIALQSHDYDLSERSFKAAIDFGKHSCFKSPTLYTGLAKALVAKKEPEKAITILNDIPTTFPGSIEAVIQANTMKGVVSQAMNKKEEAKKYFQEAANLFQNSGKNVSDTTVIELAKACLEVGEKEHGVQLIQRVISNNHEDTALLQKIQMIFNEANLSEEGNRLIAQTRAEIIKINNQGVKLVEEGKFAEALDCFEKAVEQLSGNKIIIANTAQTILMVIEKAGTDTKLLRKAKGYLDRLQKMDPEYKKIPILIELLEKLSLSSNPKG